MLVILGQETTIAMVAGRQRTRLAMRAAFSFTNFGMLPVLSVLLPHTTFVCFW